MILTVTKEHIKNGLPTLCRGCPINVSLCESTGRQWITTHRIVALCLDTSSQIVEKFAVLGPLASKFIDDFDSGQPVEPFVEEITLQIIPQPISFVELLNDLETKEVILIP